MTQIAGSKRDLDELSEVLAPKMCPSSWRSRCASSWRLPVSGTLANVNGFIDPSSGGSPRVHEGNFRADARVLLLLCDTRDRTFQLEGGTSAV